MYRIAVVEDQNTDAEHLQTMLSAYSENQKIDIRVTRWDSAEAFLAHYEHCYEIVFMDIRLPGMNGMQAARRLREKDSTVQLVFLTTLAQFAVEGYEVEAADYIIKPLTYAALRLKLPRILRRCTEEAEILIEANGKTIRLYPRDIQYAEIYDHHIQYQTQQGILRAYGTLKEVESVLTQGFFRVNNQTVVNMRYVKSVDSDNVLLGDRSFPLSRRRRKEFLEALHSSGLQI